LSAEESADALFASAISLEDRGLPEEALDRYRQLIEIAPAHADALHNRGLLLARLGRMAEAERSHRAYVAAHPDSARAHCDLADVLLAMERYDEAAAAALRAQELDTRSYLPAFVGGLAAAMQMKFGQAIERFRAARAADAAGFDRFLARQGAGATLDRDLDPRAIWLIREFDRLERCDWRGYDRYVRLFREFVDRPEGVPLSAPPLLFRSLALPIPLASRRALADGVARRLASATVGLRRSFVAADGGHRRIRVGYLSPDFGTHPTAILGAPLFRLHDRERFEVQAFSLSPSDGSHWRRAIESNADRFHDLVGRSLIEALASVRAAGLDILVDLAGTTTGALPELLAARAAPVQVSYLGFPGSSGAGFVDYLVCDPVCVPDGEMSGYGEALARLPRTFWLCEPEVANERAGRTRREHGLPESGLVLYAHHPAKKIYPAIFDCWMRILRDAPAAVLWLLDDAPGMKENLRREAAARGVAAGRLVFAPRARYAEYRARIGLADLALDTHVYNGGATTLDALAAGVPVLTCSAPGFAGRMAASALAAAGLADMVAPDLDAYAARATSLLHDTKGLRALAARVARARQDSSLFDAARRVRELEAAYQKMLERARRGELSASFDLAPL
jgi:tetratricopeptide (TPR) repeat protein